MKRNNNNNNNNTNFWISYADLMAGLLFVFILLIGAIIVKYSFLEKKSELLQDSLNTESSALIQAKKLINEKNEKISLTLKELKQTSAALKVNTQNLVKSTKTLDEKNELLKNKEIILLDLIKEKDDLKIYLSLKNKEFKDQSQILSNTSVLLKNKEQDLLKNKILIISLDENIKKLLTTNNNKDKELKNISKKNDLLLESLNSSYIVIDEKNQNLQELLKTILEKKVLLEDFKQNSDSLDDEIRLLKIRIQEKEDKFAAVAQDLVITKNKIKNFTGMKVKVISLLKKSLGSDIKIDAQSGKIILSSNVLFEQGKSQLKPEAKKALKKAVYNYFNTILENDDINKHIDKIIIEGHTNSVGSFLYNLNLSQKRAFAVMDFIFAQDFKRKDKLRHLVISSGRSYLDPVYKNNIEDKEASRRIEIKFSLKNEEAIKEIEAILKVTK